MKLIYGRTIFIPGVLRLLLDHNGFSVSQPRVTGDYPASPPLLSMSLLWGRLCDGAGAAARVAARRPRRPVTGFAVM
jgi:hypothetical protein